MSDDELALAFPRCAAFPTRGCIGEAYHSQITKATQRRLANMLKLKSPQYTPALPWENGYITRHNSNIYPRKGVVDHLITNTPKIDGERLVFQPFDASTHEARHARLRCAHNLSIFNAQSITASREERLHAWKALIDADGDDEDEDSPLVKSPFYVDYGTKLQIAPSAFIHRNGYFCDNPLLPITVGEGTFIGPNTQIITTKHDLDYRKREGGIYGTCRVAEVVIGNDCMIGSNCVVMPGVHIGDGCVIGAGSVVAKSVPAGHVAFGLPARIVRKVSRDVPDAQGLAYEEHGDRQMVVKSKAKTTEANLGTTRTPAIVLAGPALTAAAPPSPPAELLRPFPDTVNRPGPAHAGLKKMLEQHRTVTGVLVFDLLLLVLALMVGWLVVHTMLY